MAANDFPMTMKQLPSAMRPRERLLAQGPAALADAELLALLLRTGMAGRGVLALAGDVLAHCGGFAGLLARQADDFKPLKGLGPAKRAELAAVAEIARRALAQQLKAAPSVTTPQQARELAALHLQGRPFEVFAVLFLNAHGQLIELREMFRGTLTHTSVHPREVVRAALELGAARVVLAHNHPSGVAEPSDADRALTAHLAQALALVEVQVADHLVVGCGQVVSLLERGGW